MGQMGIVRSEPRRPGQYYFLRRPGSTVSRSLRWLEYWERPEMRYDGEPRKADGEMEAKVSGNAEFPGNP